MVETPACINVAGDPCSLRKTGNPVGKVRTSLRRVRNPVEFMREPKEIMDCFGFQEGIHRGSLRIPVGGYAENRSNFWEPVAETGKEPVGRYVRFERKRRCTV